MQVTADQVPLIIAVGALALGLAFILWALRTSDGARGAAKRYKEKANEAESSVAEMKSVLGAHPGVILVWQGDDIDVDADDITPPDIHGSPVALASLLRFTDDAVSVDPAVRIIEGLADLEARDASGIDSTLRIRLRELAEQGQPFSLTIIGQNGRFLEADGRTAGARVVVWITDSTIKGLEESSARGRLEEARQVIARDPTAFLDMLGKAPFPAWRISGVGRLQWANPAYVDVVDGDNLDRVLERQVMLDEKAVEQVRKTLTDGKEIDETRHIAIKGERRAMRVLSFPLSGGVGAMAFDVTEQERARDELDKHVRAHDETLNHVADAVAIFSSERKLTFHNRAFAKMWDMDEGFLLDMPSHGQLLDRLRERRKLPAQAEYAKWRAEELSYYLDISGIEEDEWHLPDNRTLKVTRQRHPMGGLLILFKDITSELNLRTKYNAMIKTQSKTLDSLHEAVVVFGSDGRLKLSNNAFAELWGVEGELLKDEPDYDDIADFCVPLFHDRDTWSAIKAHITDPGARQETSGEMRRSDGSILTYVTKPLPDGNTLIGFADVSAQRSVETALRDRAEAFETADRLKTEFVKNVSYQLRSPLQTILGYGEFLQMERIGDLNEAQRDKVDAICEASNHLNDLIGNILDLAMIEAGRMDLDISEVDLKALIDEAVSIGVTNAADTEVEVIADISPDLGRIEADETRIRQILFNLMSNALRFTDPGGAVTISAERMGDTAKLTVKDNGRGIPAEDQATRFDSFTSSDRRGAGLGLSLVKHFVQLHGGNVGIKSRPGGGTEVVCWIPVEATPQNGSNRPEKLAA
ncbi:MAG: PAS-domain containing protein [Alphaproteobacteria bacterium]|jgi:signal transduction histidine kinase|nr:PAS-domain containing protein [Henriciella sp.]MBO6697042.1 PAS-domain containing protein [Henriciella sp.]MCH9752668.1 PAS-domain containing protein [Alphaproteobacteria bacterium]